MVPTIFYGFSPATPAGNITMFSPEAEGRTVYGLEEKVKGEIVNYFFIIIHSLEQKYFQKKISFFILQKRL